MAKTKKERRAEKALRLNNKKLIKQYPWLKPYNVWTGKIWKDYNYETTWYDDIPIGWQIAFGDLLLKDIDNALAGRELHFEQIKEKYGRLTIYASAPREVHDVFEAYSHLSENICICCGKPDVHMIDTGWICPICEDCFKKNPYNNNLNYSDYICDIDDNKMPDSYSFIRFKSGNDEKITIDISEYATKIRKKYEKRRSI